MKALSIRQPWAWAILHAGKDIENRDWPTKFRGTVAVHAAKGMTNDEYQLAREFMIDAGVAAPDIPLAHAIRRGAIIGLVDIIDCVDESDSLWFCGHYGFILANPRPLPTPIPCSGTLNFWNVPVEIGRQIWAQLSPNPEAAQCDA